MSVNSTLQRARQTVEDRLPAQSQQTTLRALGDERLRDVVKRYADAWERRDVDGMVAMLVEDATFAMPPFPNWFQGRDVVIAFITSTGMPQLRYVPTRANGQAAIGWYMLDAQQESYVATSLEVLTLDGARVKEITAFAFPDLFPRFGLPAELPGGAKNQRLFADISTRWQR